MERHVLELLNNREVAASVLNFRDVNYFSICYFHNQIFTLRLLIHIRVGAQYGGSQAFRLVH